MSSISYPWIQSYPLGVNWSDSIPVYPVSEMLDRTSRDFAERPGFDFLGKRQTWGEIGRQVDCLAQGLQDLGLKKGVKVGLFLPNSPTFLIGYFAILKAGGIVVNYNPLYSVREICHQVEDSQTDFMITLDLAVLCDKLIQVMSQTRLQKLIVGRFSDLLPFPKNILFPMLKSKEIANLSDDSRIVWYQNVIRNNGQPSPVAIDPAEDIAVLQYTGGTTGVPKGAMLTHANVTANVEQAVRWFHKAIPGQEKMLGVLPFFHVFAMTAVMNKSVRSGFEIIALPRFELEQTLRLISRRKPHYFPAVPAIYNAVNNHKNLDRYDLRSLRYCISGGAPLPVEVKKKFEDITGCVVVEGYGLTETSPVVCANPIVGDNKPGSIGMPLPGTIVEIVNPEDGETIMPCGERGELCARGPQVMKGYWRKQEDSEDVLKNGRLHTGDVAVMDKTGYVYIVDRIKDMIITNGYKVYPRNVEEVIYQIPSVEECIVAGIPDTNRGEVVKAWVKLREDHVLSEKELRHFLEDKISKMEMPRTIEFRDKPLPKTMIGKLSRKDILLEEKAARDSR